ncbi:MAG TPA: methionine gamma-lyase family protein [Candidatus Acidoferrales bacterium]|nr:methionine gamma-lyase family protein [Candidatus Acidoferrales bacterium]
MIEPLLERFRVHPDVAAAARRAVARTARPAADPLLRDRVESKVLQAFVDEGIAQSDLAGTLGYGYGDAARDCYESLLARVLGAQRALARLSLVSGTHAIVTALCACVGPGERLVAATGRPYDTLRNAIADAPQSLVAQGIAYEEVPLGTKGQVDLEALRAACARPTAAVFVQRSRGYGPRPSLSAAACGEVVHVVREVAPGAVVVVDNCYGELVELTEPTEHGADLVAGSLIKNLGGSLAPGGGYVAGRAELVERVATRHYAPGLGAQVGSSLGFGRAFVQGLFQAPQIVSEALAGLDFAAALFAELGFPVDPAPGGPRYDIVQAIRLGSPSALCHFARGLQRAMPLDARFAPEPGPVPGYAEPVIMSSGAFVSGATIELSCDAPLREPFEVYLQGGTSRRHVALGALFAADRLAHESALPIAKRGDDGE